MQKNTENKIKDTLLLTLKKDAFDVMVTGEKTYEYRKPSKWIFSRLYNKDGSKKQYKFVKFTNGYSKNSRSFICEYLGFEQDTFCYVKYYSNGLKVVVEKYDIAIILGKIQN